ncbi:MAG: AAA family ATPase [Acidimicrobiales bacterium]
MPDDVTAPSSDELERFARSFSELATFAHRLVPQTSEIAELATRHLGTDPATIPAVSVMIPPVERPNLQLALDRLVADDPASTVIGISPELRHFSEFSISALLAGRFRGPGEPVPPVYDQLPVDIDETLGCVSAGIWLLHHQGEPVLIGLLPGEQHAPPEQRQPRVEVFAADPAVADAVVARLNELRRELNVYRGKVLSFSHSEYGDFGIQFSERSTTTSSEVILPAGDLASIEKHAIGIGQFAEQLTAAGRHLKRGLLLYGPPGTGKTHTVGYLMSAMPDRTVVVLQGPSVGALGYGAAIVRALSPSMLVIEDVDLIASQRGMYGMDTNPLMFQLLNEMDGLTPTDDVLFVLTTNRVDMLEPALAARPGRIDHAVEIALPDAAARTALLRLYLEGTSHDLDEIADLVERTAGVTASFIKELVRRATYEALVDSDGTISDRHLDAAVTELLEHAAPIARTMLGAHAGTRPGGDALDSEPDSRDILE